MPNNDKSKTFCPWLSDFSEMGSVEPAIDCGLAGYTGCFITRNGGLIAEDWSELSGGQLHSNVVIDEKGAVVKPKEGLDFINVFTNTTQFGTLASPDMHCNRWNSNAIDEHTWVGNPHMDEMDPWSQWSLSNKVNCATTAHLYCVQVPG